MRLLADACVGAGLVRALRAHGHDVVYAAEGPALVPDETILSQAREQDRLLLTEDYDFGALTMRDRLSAPGVVLVELHGLSAEAKSARVSQVLAGPEADLRGALTVVEPTRTRRRPLAP